MYNGLWGVITIIDLNEKEEAYKTLIAQAKELFSGETDRLANMANASALLYQGLGDINWAGFYLLKNNELVLGPFQGKPACVRIPWGKGVCGAAALRREPVLVEDVHEFPGHIACDPQSRSEMVIPVIVDGQLIGVLDIDSPVLSRFDETDKKYVTKFLEILISCTD